MSADDADSVNAGPDSMRGRVADALITGLADVSLDRLPARLCAASVELLAVTGASIRVTDQHTGAGATLHATDPVAAQLAETQFTLGTGPCIDACASGSPVLAPDLRDGPDARSWPLFAAAALESGVRAIFSFPLTVGAITAGTLDLYRDTPGSLSEHDVQVALLVADAATLAVLRLAARRSQEEDGESTAWLGEAESDREEVHQATGMVMALLGVGPEEALLRLRAHAFAESTSLSALARQIVEKRVWPGEDDRW